MCYRNVKATAKFHKYVFNRKKLMKQFESVSENTSLYTILSKSSDRTSKTALRKLLRIDSVISVNLYLISFLSLFLNIYKNILAILKHILRRSIFGKSYYLRLLNYIIT